MGKTRGKMEKDREGEEEGERRRGKGITNDIPESPLQAQDGYLSIKTGDMVKLIGRICWQDAN